MSLKQQVTGLNEFLSDVYGVPTRLSLVLSTLEFSPAQVEALHQHADLLTTELVDAIGMRTLSWSSGAMLRTVLVRRYGLDGQPPETLEALARQFDVTVGDVRELGHKALTQWGSKRTRALLERSLRQIAQGLLANPDYGHKADAVRVKLADLGRRQEAFRALQEQLRAQREGLMAPVMAALDALEATLSPALTQASEEIRSLADEVRDEALVLGASVYADDLAAEYQDGRVTWDDEGLRQYAARYPAVLRYRRVGLPTVTVRYSRRADVEEAPESDTADAG